MAGRRRPKRLQPFWKMHQRRGPTCTCTGSHTCMFPLLGKYFRPWKCMISASEEERLDESITAYTMARLCLSALLHVHHSWVMGISLWKSWQNLRAGSKYKIATFSMLLYVTGFFEFSGKYAGPKHTAIPRFIFDVWRDWTWIFMHLWEP